MFGVICSEEAEKVLMFENEKFKTGFKEVLKAVSENNVKKLFIAGDSSQSMQDKLTAKIASDCEILYIDSMKDLGKMCGIDVGASCAAILKN